MCGMVPDPAGICWLIGEPVSATHIQQSVKHPDKDVWGYFLAAGPGSLFPVTGMMNGDKYIDVLCSKLPEQ